MAKLLQRYKDFKKQKRAYRALLKLHGLWDDLDMYPGPLFRIQKEIHSPSAKTSSQHFRNAVYHYWLTTHPSKHRLNALLQLAEKEPDVHLRADLTSAIQSAQNDPRRRWKSRNLKKRHQLRQKDLHEALSPSARSKLTKMHRDLEQFLLALHDEPALYTPSDTLQTFLQFNKRYPLNVSAYITLIAELVRFEDFTSALRLSHQLSASGVVDPRLSFYTATAYLQAGDAKKAIDNLVDGMCQTINSLSEQLEIFLSSLPSNQADLAAERISWAIERFLFAGTSDELQSKLKSALGSLNLHCIFDED